MPDLKERLTVLSEKERFAFYDFPDFSLEQRAEYFLLTKPELRLSLGRPGVSSQVYCVLQIAYFKAKQFFFSPTWDEIPPEDLSFVLEAFFPNLVFVQRPISKRENYAQRAAIAKLFQYRFWSKALVPQLSQYALQAAKRDAVPHSLAIELMAYLKKQKIIRPGHRNLQDIVSKAFTTLRGNLTEIIRQDLDGTERLNLQKLLELEENISELATLKQDAKNFKFRVLKQEGKKQALLKPLHQAAQRLLPKFAISKQNIHYYGSLVDYYTIYDLRRLQSEQAYLYLLCYVFERYQKLNDNLVDAFCYHERQIHDEAKERAQQAYAKQQAAERRKFPLAGRLLLLYVVDEFDNKAPFGKVRRRAFSILPKKQIKSLAKQMLNPQNTQLDLRWEAGDQLFSRARKRLRPLFQALDFSSTHPESPWLQAIRWMQGIFLSKQSISQRPFEECSLKTIPERLRPYLLRFDAKGEAVGLQSDRYESWIYHQIRARLLSGELFLNDTTKHRAFQEELAYLNNQEGLNQLDIFWLRKPIEVQVDSLLRDLDAAWKRFNADFRQGKLKHLDYDANKKTMHWRKSKAQEAAEEDEKQQQSFYAKLPIIDIANVLRFSNETNFLSAFTPLQPRYTKQIAHEDSLLATILAQAMGHGNWRMAEMSDIPYHSLEFTQQQYLRVATLQSANDLLSNAISKLSIFPHYSFDPEILYGSVDGQKFDVETENIRARYSRKYFANGVGVSAYSLLANHIPLQTQLIGAHEHESYFLFDIWYNNTSDITPAVLTGDMHSINRMNFILMYCFEGQFCPRFTSLDRQLKHLYCHGDVEKYSKNQIQPVGSINRNLIIEQKENIERIIKALALKETTQSNLVRKLCTHVQNPAYKGMAELDKLVRSIYTLRYLRDPKLFQNVHRSQNRIESYHQMRADIAQVGGKKQLIGKTEIALEIANQCGRLVANAMIYYNSVILSRFHNRCVENNDQAGLALLKKRSPVASQHIHLLGRYTFYTNKQTVDINDMVKNIVL